MDSSELYNLNKKLALFVEFKSDETDFPTIRWYYPDGKLIEPFAQIDLVNDANAQIKWIYPKLVELRLDFDMRRTSDFIVDGVTSSHQYVWTIIKGMSIVGQGEDATNPSLAFALAVEKYIDSLENKNG